MTRLACLPLLAALASAPLNSFAQEQSSTVGEGVVVQSTRGGEGRRPLEISAGASSLLTLSGYAGSISGALGIAVHGPVAGAWTWGLGGNLGWGPLRPEAFVHFLATPTFGGWRPAAGIELGVASRGDLGEGENLLRELRSESVDSVSPFYLGIYSRPLSFCIARRFRVSALELQVGTHLSPLGRVVRLRVGILSMGMDL